jgi:hypothetical protein
MSSLKNMMRAGMLTASFIASPLAKAEGNLPSFYTNPHLHGQVLTNELLIQHYTQMYNNPKLKYYSEGFTLEDFLVREIIKLKQEGDENRKQIQNMGGQDAGAFFFNSNESHIYWGKIIPIS